MTDPDTLRALAAELCEVKEGSRELDNRIATLCSEPDKPALLALNYTYSIDAKLPGEDIIRTSLDRHTNKWVAGTRNHCSAIAHTEPLARRAAALMAMAEQKERKG